MPKTMWVLFDQQDFWQGLQFILILKFSLLLRTVNAKTGQTRKLSQIFVSGRIRQFWWLLLSIAQDIALRWCDQCSAALPIQTFPFQNQASQGSALSHLLISLHQGGDHTIACKHRASALWQSLEMISAKCTSIEHRWTVSFGISALRALIKDVYQGHIVAG